jgi:hypothetical protein
LSADFQSCFSNGSSVPFPFFFAIYIYFLLIIFKNTFYSVVSSRALAKKQLFWFFMRWLLCRQKPNVLFVRGLFFQYVAQLFCLSIFSESIEHYLFARFRFWWIKNFSVKSPNVFINFNFSGFKNSNLWLQREQAVEVSRNRFQQPAAAHGWHVTC